MGQNGRVEESGCSVTEGKERERVKKGDFYLFKNRFRAIDGRGGASKEEDEKEIKNIYMVLRRTGM